MKNLMTFLAFVVFVTVVISAAKPSVFNFNFGTTNNYYAEKEKPPLSSDDVEANRQIQPPAQRPTDQSQRRNSGRAEKHPSRKKRSSREKIKQLKPACRAPEAFVRDLELNIPQIINQLKLLK